MLYGRCGYLYALLLARKYVGASPATAGIIKQLVQQVVEEGKRGAAQLRATDPDSKWRMMWSWHGSYYLGGELAMDICMVLCRQTPFNGPVGSYGCSK